MELSLQRLESRQNHLTLGPGGGKIIESMDKKFVPVTKSEGFDQIFEIKSQEDLDRVYKYFGLDQTQNQTPTNKISLIKFPRTKHLTNLGAMARDDLLADMETIKYILSSEVVVEEKIDGANMGFSLDPQTGKILVQNRSHYVSSTSHHQFKKLDQWVETHKDGLLKLLDGGKNILYGEWLYATHSIPYTSLPDYKFRNIF